MEAPPPPLDAKRHVRAALVVVIAILVVFSFIVGYAVLRAIDANTVEFGYHAVLTMNGTGTARISLPLPVDERLQRGLSVSPASSTFVINGTGAEPAIDVTLQRTTWVNISVRATRSAQFPVGVDLTRVAPYSSCGDCAIELALGILGGTVTGVRVDLTAGWDFECWAPRWYFDGWVEGGVRVYSGHWATIVC
jgi:hypothetical protein